MNITRNQWFQLIGMFLNACAISGTYFTDTFGSSVSKTIVGTAGFFLLLVQGASFILSGQTQQVKDVANMPGVERITVNTLANQNLAQVAIDPLQNKVAPEDHKVEEVTQIAKGNV